MLGCFQNDLNVRSGAPLTFVRPRVEHVVELARARGGREHRDGQTQRRPYRDDGSHRGFLFASGTFRVFSRFSRF